MKRLIVFSLLLSLGACVNPLAAVTNPVNSTNLYQGELVFDASLKTFNELKGLCASRVLPSKCRTYVVSGQRLIVKIAAADVSARNFVDKNPTLDATNVVQAFTGLVSNFNTTVDALSATKNWEHHMDIAGVIALLQVVVTNLPGAIKTTNDLVDLGTKFYATVNGTQPSASDIAALRSSIDADVILALTPLPAAQPGDPDYVKPA